MSKLKSIFFVIMVAFLSACGGGGGSAGVNPTAGAGTSPIGTTTGPITTPTAVITPSDFIFELDKTSIANSGSDGATLNVLVLDVNRNVLSGIPVSVSVDAEAVYAASNATTDASGKAGGKITIGGNKANRTVNATISVGSIRKVASVLVTGSQISVVPLPATPTPGMPVIVNLSTMDSAVNPIQNAVLTFSGSAGLVGTVTTNLAGQATVSFIAPSAPGTATLVVSGLGVSTTKILQVQSISGGSIPPVLQTTSSVSLSPQPTSIAPNFVGSTTNRSRLSAKFLTTGNAGIAGVRVRFEIVPPKLENGEAISTGNSVVYTDASGVAEADYIAGTRSSPTNGVSVRVCYSLVDFTSASDCPSQVTANLTVAGSPLSISIGDDNLLEKGLGQISYIKKFLIQVNDSAGVAVPDAIVAASVDISHFGKGVYGGRYPNNTTPPLGTNSFATVQSGISTTSVISSDATVPSVLISGTSTAVFNVWCASEDKNRNGFLDTGEDTNNDGVLQPRKAEIIVSYVSGNKTNSQGQLLLQVTYSQNVGSWLAYVLRATTSVAGSEGDASKAYITDVLQTDVLNGSFRTPPYGTGSCRSPV